MGKKRSPSKSLQPLLLKLSLSPFTSFHPLFLFLLSFSLHTLSLVPLVPSSPSLPFLPSFLSPPLSIYPFMPLSVSHFLLLFFPCSSSSFPFFGLAHFTLWLHYSSLNQSHPVIPPFSPDFSPPNSPSSSPHTHHTVMHLSPCLHHISLNLFISTLSLSYSLVPNPPLHFFSLSTPPSVPPLPFLCLSSRSFLSPSRSLRLLP